MTDPRETLDACRAAYRRARETLRQTCEQIACDAREVTEELDAGDVLAVPEPVDPEEEISTVQHLTRAEQALDEALAATSGVRPRPRSATGGGG